MICAIKIIQIKLLTNLYLKFLQYDKVIAYLIIIFIVVLIIDFIDMLSFNNRKQVERRLKERCRNDRARIQIGRISTVSYTHLTLPTSDLV